MSHYRGYRIESTRLPDWDYRRSAWYFVTVCTKDRACFFGTIRRGIVGLSRVGCIAHRFWAAIPDHFDRARLDAFVAMPNHVHGLIGLMPGTDPVETLHALRSECPWGATSLQRPENDDAYGNDAPDTNPTMSALSPKPGSVSTIIRSYKSAVTRWARRNDCPDFAWQPRFYDHVVRNRRSLRRIRRYIVDNPIHWLRDRHYVG